MSVQAIVPFEINGQKFYTHTSWLSEKQYNAWNSIPNKTETLLSTTVSPQSHSSASYFKRYLVLEKNTHRQISIQQLRKTFDWSWRIIDRKLYWLPWITQITINKRIQSFSIQKRMWINSLMDQRGISCEPPLKRLQKLLSKT